MWNPRDTLQPRRSRPDRSLTEVGAAVAGLLVVFWSVVFLEQTGVTLPLLRAAVGVVVLLFVPGAVLAYASGVSDVSVGRFVVLSVALSLAVLAVVTVASLPLRRLGVETPLATVSIGAALTATLVGLFVVGYLSGPTGGHPGLPEMRRYDVWGPIIATCSALVLLAVLGAGRMTSVGDNSAMYLFVTAVVVTVVLLATRIFHRNTYPVVVFSLAVSVLLHRNLLSDHVIGADIQATYFLAQEVARVGYWSPELGGALISIPVVSGVPVAVSAVTGIELVRTFTLVYLVLFSFVPVGIYYVCADVFSEEVGLFGALFFLFYHGSFYYTPGKQLLSGLFVVSLLVLYFRGAPGTDGRYGGLPGAGTKATAATLGVGLVATHYGMTYAVGIAFLIAAVLLGTARLWADGLDPGLPLRYPAVLLAGATAWYAYAAEQVLATVASIPASVFEQSLALLQREVIPGTGAGYVTQQTTPLDDIRLGLYAFFTLAIGVGLAWTAVREARHLRRNESTRHLEFTVLALPLFALFVASYLFVVGLLADRIYQMVLVVLAPYVALGYRSGYGKLGAVGRRFGTSTGLRERFRADGGPRIAGRAGWSLLAVLLASLFVFNSGMAFALAGTAQTSAFDGDAHDLVFDGDERAAAEWVRDRPEIERQDYRASPLDHSDDVRIYTDSTTSQLLRSIVPEHYYNVEVIELKSRYHPQLRSERVDEPGYVFVRKRSVVDPATAERTGPSILTRSERDELVADRTVVFENDAVVVLEVEER